MPYSTITDAEIDPDSPVTTSLCVKFRDNPIAIAQANAGAPKIVLNALNNSFVFSATSTSADITVPAFATTPTGNITHMITATVVDTVNNDSGVTVNLNGGALFSVPTNVSIVRRATGCRTHVTTNAQQVFSFALSAAEATISVTVLSIAS